MRKQEMKARIRYNKGIKGCGPDEGKPLDAESFVLETWDEEYKSWQIHTIAPLRRCVEYPNVKEQEFINYQFLMTVFQLKHLGYSITLAKAGEL